MSERNTEHEAHIRIVSRIVAADAVIKALDAGIVAWEDYPELPERVWTEISVRIRRDASRLASTEDYGESYGALSALAEEV